MSKACTQGYNVLFKNAATLSTELCEAKDNYHLGKLERTLAKVDLLRDRPKICVNLHHGVE